MTEKKRARGFSKKKELKKKKATLGPRKKPQVPYPGEGKK